MNEQKNNGRGIFYGVIGVATLVVAVVGATFAYFTASANNNTAITGNMAEVKLSLTVEKVTTVDEDREGMIPMSNGMVEPAVLSDKGKGVCLDNNDNAVCQIYRITLTNASSAGQFVDGYVALKGGSGRPNDYTYITLDSTTAATKQNKYPITGLAGDASVEQVGTTMRWAQVFVGAVDESTVVTGDTDEDDVCDDDEPNCYYKPTSFTTAGRQTLGTADEYVDFSSIAAPNDAKNISNIRILNNLEATLTGDTDNDKNCSETEINAGCREAGVLEPITISGNTYNVIGTNYIRVSDHAWLKDATTGKETYDRTADVTSALVFNHNIPAQGQAVYYVAVWLTETGYNQSLNATEVVGNETKPIASTVTTFFQGNVTFISAQGSEVSATFANHARVPSVG